MLPEPCEDFAERHGVVKLAIKMFLLGVLG